MAQIVDYWINNPEYTEGPFVLCRQGLTIDSFRIEVQGNGRCPQLPDLSIYDLLKERMDSFCLGWSHNARMAPQVDWLNEQVRLGQIVWDESVWIPVLEKRAC